MNRFRFQTAFIAVASVLLLTACGNRGPLVLPDEAPPPMTAPAPPADGSEASR